MAFYVAKMPQRVFLVNRPSEWDWRSPGVTARVPRALVFLDLPGQTDATEAKVPQTKLIPTAAEFENGVIVPLYQQFIELTKRELWDKEDPPEYPEQLKPYGQTIDERRRYWVWFSTRFSARRAMQVVEAAAAEHGRIRWIDYRVPVSTHGDTLHLHVCPGGHYDTGTFAYNLIKRGFKHGVRLVGTLKSEPDMNVLAIYDK
jgi:hypothetical protein